MSDLISRQAAIDAIDSLYFDTVEDHDRTKERIKRLSSAQPKTQLSAEDATIDATSDLISRQAAIDAVTNHGKTVLESYPYDLITADLYAAAHKHVIHVLAALPSAQPEIVRCEDCIEWDSDSEWCNRHGGTMQENDFCSRVERRTDG